MALDILSSDEIHAFGIDIVQKYLKRDGFEIIQINYEKAIDPQVIARMNGILFFVLIRTACYPYKGALEKGPRLNAVLLNARKKEAKCVQACVGIANANGTTDLERSIPIRNGGFYVSYNGLEEIETKVDNYDVAYNKAGEIAGGVIQLSDGRFVIVSSEKSDSSSLLMQACRPFAENLEEWQRIEFSRWANLPLDTWTSEHKKYFVFSLLHYFMEIRSNQEELPNSLINVISNFPPQTLPPLRTGLSDEIRRIFKSLFVFEE